MKTVQFEPNGKINLGLIIKGKRSDGYHLVETVFVPIPLSDILEVTPTDGKECEIEIRGIQVISQKEDNLCYRAWKLLRDHHPSIGGVKIVLTKRIPAGSGLGGGSSDAAFTMIALRDLFDESISMHELFLLAGRLGADVPFFLHNKPCLGTGTGTNLIPIHLPLPYEIRIITPPIHSGTAEAYRSLNLSAIDSSVSLREIIQLPVPDWKYHLRNDLEAPVFAKYPQLKEIKEKLYAEGAVYASMSGSGSAVYGLFEKG
jgi:4-diphosphocytidyl-2-C-methyl-D-erythritol kinase